MGASELLLTLARPGQCLNTTQERHMRKLASMVVFYLRARMLRFLRENGGRPISISYQSDCTPASNEETVVVKLGNKRVVRRGRRTSEYLVSSHGRLRGGRVFSLATH